MICGVDVDEGNDVDIAAPFDGASRRFSDGAGGVFARLMVKNNDKFINTIFINNSNLVVS
jgi:hypothetical protein